MTVARPVPPGRVAGLGRTDGQGGGAGLAGSALSVRTAEPVAGLTFDDGPSEAVTAEVLEMFQRHAVRATFFVARRALLLGDLDHDLGEHLLGE